MVPFHIRVDHSPRQAHRTIRAPHLPLKQCIREEVRYNIKRQLRAHKVRILALLVYQRVAQWGTLAVADSRQPRTLSRC